ncbi:unnamed protein product, partial [marine sediment metagenome]
MQEIIDILGRADRLLCDYEETDGFKTTIPLNTGKVYLAHGA